MGYKGILDYEYNTRIENGLIKYAVTLVVNLREVQSLYYEGLEESYYSGVLQSGEEPSEEDYEEYIRESINEFDSEYGEKPFEFHFKDTTTEVELDTFLEDNHIKRTWFDVMRITYRNQLAIDYIKEFITTEEKRKEMLEKFLTYDMKIIESRISQFKELLLELLGER